MDVLYRAFLFLCSFWVFSTVLAQETGALKLPVCAQQCLIEAFGTGLCSPLDQTCICTNATFQSTVTGCVRGSCSISEALATKNFSLTNCGAPHRDRGQRYVVLSNVMVTLAAAFVAVRFTFKAIVSRLEFGYDDWSVLATLITAVPSAIITVFGTVKHGLGQDIWTLSPEDITEMLKYFYIMACLYFTQVALLKLSLTFFYVRVFPSAGVQRLLWGTVVFIVLWGTSFVITAVFQCRPISYFWKRWDGLHEGSCLDINAITSSNAGISIALDLWILGIPLWQLWGLKIHWKKKIGVGMMFCVGTFVTIVSILRLQALVHFAASDNASWEFYDVSVWSSIETCVGIMCACLPTLRLVLVKLFPILAGSSNRSRQQYHNYGTGTDLKSFDPSTRSRTTNVAISNPVHTPQSSDFELSEGITVKTSYLVQHNRNDTDEASLVSHEEDKKL